ncbi:MAG: SagB/ThcOx family dehydrogenase [Acidimicrobiia bacterium]|nr:SagB/ThcOx family dehydrogenase [Acidimicrobiia bacterium]
MTTAIGEATNVLRWPLLAAAFLLIMTGCAASAPPAVLDQNQRYTETIALPAPRIEGSVSIEEALATRRSRREFADEMLSSDDIGQIFWSGQGMTDGSGKRTSPSAGALYPIELYAVSGSWVAHYLPADHAMERRDDPGTLGSLGDAAFDQQWITTAPVVFVITGVVSRTQAKYGGAAEELMIREAGHVAQNMLLQATALDFAVVPVGGFDPKPIGRSLALPPGEVVLYLLPVGIPT